MILKTDNITMQFGGVTAVNLLNIEINEHEIVALIGPNGAGKTTAFNMITGVYTPTSGDVIYTDAQGEEQKITGKRPSEIAKMGVARTFQNIRLFKNLSVYENVMIAKHLHLKSDFMSAALHLPWYNKEQREMEASVEALLRKVDLWELRDEKASSLPYGQQRRLEIVRALATGPRLLLLDEPAAGMNPKETDELTEFIRQIRDEYDLTVFMIEHHMDLVMEISDRIYVLDFGMTIAEGTPELIQNNKRVIDAYLWMKMLKVQDLFVAYGGIEALKGISLEVPEGKIVTLIGANGAGKSTLLRTIVGLVKPKSGTISYNEQNITGLNSQKIVKTGITLVPEGRRVFPNLTVLENLQIGAYMRNDKEEIAKDIKWVYELFPRLEERSWQMAGTLSGGEQQMLAVGRALLSRPQLMMMDEPSLGLAPLIIKDIFNIIQEINSRGMTILLIEQNANMALKVAHQAYVLETGKITMSGTGQELLENPDIKAAYLGKKRNQK